MIAFAAKPDPIFTELVDRALLVAEASARSAGFTSKLPLTASVLGQQDAIRAFGHLRLLHARETAWTVTSLDWVLLYEALTKWIHAAHGHPVILAGVEVPHFSVGRLVDVFFPDDVPALPLTSILDSDARPRAREAAVRRHLRAFPPIHPDDPPVRRVERLTWRELPADVLFTPGTSAEYPAPAASDLTAAMRVGDDDDELPANDPWTFIAFALTDLRRARTTALPDEVVGFHASSRALYPVEAFPPRLHATIPSVIGALAQLIAEFPGARGRLVMPVAVRTALLTMGVVAAAYEDLPPFPARPRHSLIEDMPWVIRRVHDAAAAPSDEPALPDELRDLRYVPPRLRPLVTAAARVIPEHVAAGVSQNQRMTALIASHWTLLLAACAAADLYQDAPIAD